MALLGGGYWYLRNLGCAGNPLPWIEQLGPLELPGPDQEIGGREGHNVLGYLTDGAIWSDWFGPGLHEGFGLLWPLLLALGGGRMSWPAPGGDPSRPCGWRRRPGSPCSVAWLLGPTSASGPDGTPLGFVSGLRYLAPALALGLRSAAHASGTARARCALGAARRGRDPAPFHRRLRQPWYSSYLRSRC